MRSEVHSATICRPVLFLGARGSGEYSPGSANWPKGRKADDPYGFGGEVNEVYNKFSAGLSASPETYSVDYRTDNVRTLFHDYPKYFNDLASGVTWVIDKLSSRASACPDQLIVLAGYSQGAMVMHRILRRLGTTKADAPILARIAAVVLVGDGDQVPHDNVKRFGTAGDGAHGVGLALRTISHSSDATLPSYIGTRVLEVCNAHDIVCGWTDLDLACLDIGTATATCLYGVYVHLHYPGSKPLADAAAAASADLRTRLRETTVGHAIEVPGIAALNTGLYAETLSVACASAGNCSAGGFYQDSRAGTQQAFVASEVNGSWGTAIKVPGSATLNTGNQARVTTVSCGSPGNCAAAGSYLTNPNIKEGSICTAIGRGLLPAAAAHKVRFERRSTGQLAGDQVARAVES